MSKSSLILTKVATFLAGAGAGACFAILIYYGAIQGEATPSWLLPAGIVLAVDWSGPAVPVAQEPRRLRRLRRMGGRPGRFGSGTAGPLPCQPLGGSEEYCGRRIKSSTRQSCSSKVRVVPLRSRLM